MIIAVGGGKGGTGKSSVAVNLAVSLSKKGKKVMLLDLDVESPVDHILLGITERVLIEEIVSFLPKIKEEDCIKCAVCVKRCPEHALIGTIGKVPMLLKELCSGCKMCYYICPANAIENSGRVIGSIYESEKYNVKLIQGEVKPGVKQHINVTVRTFRYAQRYFPEFDLIIMDLAPGTGAGIWYPLAKSDIVIAVTEASPLGYNDFTRFVELVNGKKLITVINKADLSEESAMQIEKHASEIGSLVFRIPYDESFIQSYISGKPSVISSPSSKFSEVISKIGDIILDKSVF